MIYIKPKFASDSKIEFSQGDIFFNLPYLSIDNLIDDIATQWNSIIMNQKESPTSFKIFPISTKGVLLDQDCDIPIKKLLLFALIRERPKSFSSNLKKSFKEKLKIVRDDTRYHFLPPFESDTDQMKPRIVDFTQIFLVPKKCLEAFPANFLRYHMKEEPKRIFANKIAKYFSRLPYEDMWFLNEEERKNYKEAHNINDKDFETRIKNMN